MNTDYIPEKNVRVLGNAYIIMFHLSLGNRMIEEKYDRHVNYDEYGETVQQNISFLFLDDDNDKPKSTYFKEVGSIVLLGEYVIKNLFNLYHTKKTFS